jgi:hypothetical protein
MLVQWIWRSLTGVRDDRAYWKGQGSAAVICAGKSPLLTSHLKYYYNVVIPNASEESPDRIYKLVFLIPYTSI